LFPQPRAMDLTKIIQTALPQQQCRFYRIILLRQTLALAGWSLQDVITQDQILRLLYRQKELNFPPGVSGRAIAKVTGTATIYGLNGGVPAKTNYSMLALGRPQPGG